MATQNELNQAKASLKNTLQTKRLTTLQKYNHFRFKKEKKSFESFKKTFLRLNNIIVSLFHADINNSNLSDSEKLELTKNHKSLSCLFTRLDAAKTKFDIAFQLDNLSYSLFGFHSHYVISSDSMLKKEFIALKQKYLIQIIKVCI